MAGAAGRPRFRTTAEIVSALTIVAYVGLAHLQPVQVYYLYAYPDGDEAVHEQIEDRLAE
jgi:hypothetical protein